MKIQNILFLAILFALIGCSKTDLQTPTKPDEPGLSKTITLTASLATESKVGFEDNGTSGIKLTWAADDTFSMYDHNGNWAADFKLKPGSIGQVNGEFEMVSGGMMGAGMIYTAVYPKIKSANTLANYQIILSGQTQDGNGDLKHMAKLCRLQQDDYLYIPNDPKSLNFVHHNAVMTLKLAAPAGYNAAVNGIPNLVILRNGDKTYNLNLSNIDWNSEITAHVMIEPTAAAGQNFSVCVYTDKATYAKSMTASKPYVAGMRYTATYTSFTETQGYTLDNADNIPLDVTDILILDAVDAAASSSTFDKLKNNLTNTGRTANATVSIPNATHIPNEAFLWCDKLETINIPNVISIGEDAFNFCTSLISIDAPKATSIGNGAFFGCSFKSLDLPNATSVGEHAFRDCFYLNLVNFPKLISIGKNAFYFCAALTSIDLPEVTAIGEHAFNSCYRLKYIDLPKVTSILYATFYDCSALTSIAFPNVISVGDAAFCNNYALKSIYLPNVNSVGSRAFTECYALNSIDLPKVTSIESGAFSNICTTLYFGTISLATEVAAGTILQIDEYIFENTETSKFDLTLGSDVTGVSGNTWTIGSANYTFNSIIGGKP